MLWVTRAHVHMDRVASPWLLLRFVDPEATFAFVGWHDDGALPDEAIPFGLPGHALGPHDADGTTFEKILAAYDLADDPALALMGRMLASGVRQVFGRPAGPTETAEEIAFGTSLNGLGLGLGAFRDDDEHIAAALVLYDALYLYAQLQTMDPELRERMPKPPPERATFLRQHLEAPGRASYPPREGPRQG